MMKILKSLNTTLKLISQFWLNSIYFKNITRNKVRRIGLELQKKGIEVRSGFWPLNLVKNVNSKYIYEKKLVKIFMKIRLYSHQIQI